MSEQEQSIVQDYCKRMDDRHKSITGVLYALLGIMLGATILVFISFGEVKAQTRESAGKIQEINNNYVPMYLLDGIAQNYAYLTQEIVATVTGDKEAVREICKKYVEFQSTMIKQINQSRGGYSPTTRGAKSIK